MQERTATEIVVPAGTSVWLTVNEGDLILVRGTAHPDDVPGLITIDANGDLQTATHKALNLQTMEAPNTAIF